MKKILEFYLVNHVFKSLVLEVLCSYLLILNWKLWRLFIDQLHFITYHQLQIELLCPFLL